MTEGPVSDFLEELIGRSRSSLDRIVKLVDVETIPPVDQIGLNKPTWYRTDDVVAVMADLKASTSFNYDRANKSVARFYDAYMGPLVSIAERLRPAFVDIQGDGLFAIFDGEMRYERAFVTGVTMQTFVALGLLPALQGRQLGLPETGLKVGIAAGPVFVNRVGIASRHELIWAGWPVNWAAKCAQKADAGEMIVTPSVWRLLSGNDYAHRPCVCSWRRYAPTFLVSPWASVTVGRLPEGHRECAKMSSWWCAQCGDDSTSAILAGERSR